MYFGRDQDNVNMGDIVTVTARVSQRRRQPMQGRATATTEMRSIGDLEYDGFLTRPSCNGLRQGSRGDDRGED